MAKKFYIETFGCQMNELDSQKIAGSLCHHGLEQSHVAIRADVVILNTCSIREKAVQKVYARLGEIGKQKARNKNLVVGVVGCMAQLEGMRILEKAPTVNFIAGPQKSQALPRLIEASSGSAAATIDLRSELEPEPLETGPVLRENSWSAGVTISEGCNRRCSFCVVPATRGSERNRDSEDVVHEVSDLVSQGYIEIMLLGQTVNSYRDPNDRRINFARLLKKLCLIEGLKRIRFTSPHPRDFSDELLDLMITCPQVCNHIHLPVQSGSSRILRMMRRGYTRETYLEIISKIQQAARPIAVSTDIIVGFPGETDNDFRQTLDMLDTAQFDCVYSFKYSPRPNTHALTLADEIPDQEKGTRLRILQEHQKLIQYNKNAAYMDREMEILTDSRAKSRFALCGRAPNNKIVNFDGPESLLGQVVPVKITGFSANSLKGVWIH